MTPSLADITDADPLNGDMQDAYDGPLFFALPQSVQDDLAAHFLARMSVEGGLDEAYPELLAA